MIILLTGGSACGKSTYGEALAIKYPLPRYYIAAMEPYGEESRLRIARHREMRREKGFTTIERYIDLAHLELPQKGGVALLECLCNLTANEMFRPDGAGADTIKAVLDGIENLAAQCAVLIVITNDVGSGGDDGFDESTLEYIRTLGEINRLAAAHADSVAELVCGIPLMLKGERL